MDTTSTTAPLLVFAYGNPSRGDDALGPQLHDMLARHLQQSVHANDVDLLTDYQLQVEHAIDLEHREAVIFVDASVSIAAPYEFHRLAAEQDSSYTTHAISPAAVMAVYETIHHQPAPPCYLLSIRGYRFELGQTLSRQADDNLQHACSDLVRLIDSGFSDCSHHETILRRSSLTG